MNTKSGAVSYFEFLRPVLKRFPPSPICKPSGGNMDLYGVFFYQNYGYVFNNVMMGRIQIDDDFPFNDRVAFFSFRDRLTYYSIDEIRQMELPVDGLFAHYNLMHLNRICDHSFPNQVYIDSSDFYQLMDQWTVKAALTCTANFRIEFDHLVFQIYGPKNKEYPEHKFPLLRSAQNAPAHSRDQEMCSVNLYYLMQIVKNTFRQCDIMGIRFDGTSPLPLVFSGYGPNQPKVTWVLAKVASRRPIV